MGDALVSEWHSRDSDSLVLKREAEAVEEWNKHSEAGLPEGLDQRIPYL
jgi:hypothetical protein